MICCTDSVICDVALPVLAIVLPAITDQSCSSLELWQQCVWTNIAAATKKGCRVEFYQYTRYGRGGSFW